VMLRLAAKSLWHRRLTASLVVLSIALAVTLLMGVERIRGATRTSFAAAVSGTDLIVAARASPVHLLLFSVFGIGNPTNNLAAATHREIAGRPEVAWTIPIALGDSHKGYRVVGTTAAFFQHFRYGEARALAFQVGGAFAGEDPVILGAAAARALGYRVGDAVVLAHGAGDVSFALHDAHPFRVAGILQATGTPVDRALYVPLEGLAELHRPANDDEADPLAAAMHGHDAAAPEATLTAVFVGLRSRNQALGVQRALNEWKGEALTAILPAVTLQELWEIIGVAENALLAVSALAVAVGLGSMLVALLTGANERRREMAILRSAGATPRNVFTLMMGEAGLLALVGVLLGATIVQATFVAGESWLASRYGLTTGGLVPSGRELVSLGLVVIAGILIGAVPAYRAYRQSLADGLTIRL
jgi:putative ABC transport system permease protein